MYCMQLTFTSKLKPFSYLYHPSVQPSELLLNLIGSIYNQQYFTSQEYLLNVMELLTAEHDGHTETQTLPRKVISRTTLFMHSSYFFISSQD